MRISIVTPSYNQGQFIEDAIKSVLKQNWPDFEHIIIDNCSTDETIQILKKYPHVRWISEPDKGQSDAINKGFKLASGDIIGWLNADDIYTRGCFDVVTDHFTQYPEVQVLYGDIVWANRSLQPIRRKYEHRFDKSVLLYYGCVIPSAATFFRRSIIDDGNYLDTSLKVSMDYDFFCLLASRDYRFLYVPEIMAYFRVWDQNFGKQYRHLWHHEVMQVRKRYTRLFAKETRAFPAMMAMARSAIVIKRLLLKWRTHGFKGIRGSRFRSSDLEMISTNLVSQF